MAVSAAHCCEMANGTMMETNYCAVLEDSTDVEMEHVRYIV